MNKNQKTKTNVGVAVYSDPHHKGITLIALIITIIILLILAGVAISITVDQDNLFDKAEQAKTDWNEKVTEEQSSIEELLAQLENGVSVDKIFDSNGKDETAEGYDPNKLHIGDFVNYDAGRWETAEEIETIKVGPNDALVTASTAADMVAINGEQFQFGGFGVGAERNAWATYRFNSDDEFYLKETKSDGTKQMATGWRVFDVTDDGIITLISAGCSEDYFHGYGDDNSGYISEYILSGNINANASSMNLPQNYTKRTWNEYVNRTQGANNATTLTKQRLNEWFTKYFGASGNSDDIGFGAGFSFHDSRYSSVAILGDTYWLASASNSHELCTWILNGSVSSNNSFPLGIRVLVTLDANVKLSKQKVGTKTITSFCKGEAKTENFNVWNIVSNN